MVTILCLTAATRCVWLHRCNAVALLQIQHFASVNCLSVRVPMGCVPLTPSCVHRLCSQPQMQLDCMCCTHFGVHAHSFIKLKSTMQKLVQLIRLPNYPFWPCSKLFIFWPTSLSLSSPLVRASLFFSFNNSSQNTATARFVSQYRFSSPVNGAAILISITASTLALRNHQAQNE